MRVEQALAGQRAGEATLGPAIAYGCSEVVAQVEGFGAIEAEIADMARRGRGPGPA